VRLCPDEDLLELGALLGGQLQLLRDEGPLPPLPIERTLLSGGVSGQQESGHDERPAFHRRLSGAKSPAVSPPRARNSVSRRSASSARSAGESSVSSEAAGVGLAEGCVRTRSIEGVVRASRRSDAAIPTAQRTG